MTTQLPEQEVQRLKVLFSYGILDTPPEQAFDDLVLLTSQILQAPIAIISFVDTRRCWYKARVGLEINHLPRVGSFETVSLEQTAAVVVPDVLADPRFATNPPILSQPPVRFYAGVPLVELTGYVLGVLAVMDHHPRDLTAQQLEILFGLGRQVMALLQSRLQFMAFSETIAASNHFPNLPSTTITGSTHQVPQLARQLNLTLTQARLLAFEKQQREQLAVQNLTLEAARQQAEQESKMKTAFLSIMSHEIRTPMNAVLGVTDLLANTNLDTEQQELLRIVRAGTNSLLTLINDVLDFSRLDSGEVSLEKLNFDLRSCVEEAVDLLSAIAYAKGIEVAAVIPPQLYTQLMGDGNRLRQILINLLGNAIKFTDQGDVAVRATVRSETAQTIEIEFSVTDTGIGIPDEAQAKIFQPYAQAHQSIARTHGGTGLGLAICKQLVELMGGRIWVESDGQQGTRFAFVLTFDKQPSPISLPLLPSHLQTLKGLLISPHKIHPEIILPAAALWQLPIDAVDNCEAACTLAEQAEAQGHPYGIVILDDFLSEGMLRCLISQLTPERTAAPIHVVLLVSPTHQAQFQPASLLRGVDRADLIRITCLPKPLKPTRLFHCLTNLLQRQQDGPVASPTKPDIEAPPRPSTLTEPNSLKILVVEDTPVNQAVILRMLKSLGYRADLAEDGLQALERQAQASYDLILMDCQLPKMDGYEATRQIRTHESESKSQPIIIAMTANALIGDREKCLAAGMDDYLSKPIGREDLGQMIARWETSITSRSTSQSTDAQPADQPPVQPTSTESVAAEPELSPTVAAIATSPEVIAATVIQWPYLLKIAEGDADFARELLGLFLNDHFPYLTQLRSAIANHDLPAIKQAAHKFKGASSNLGLQAIQELVSEMEQRCLDQQYEEIPTMLTQLELFLKQIETFLQDTPQ